MFFASRLIVGAVVILLVAEATGCGRPTGGAEGPHPTRGGSLIELPSKSGYVELTVESSTPNAPSSKMKGMIVALFMNPEGTGPLEPAPSDVAFTDDNGKTHTLKPAKANPASAARFESVPLAIAVGGEPTGVLTARVSGESIKLVSRPR